MLTQICEVSALFLTTDISQIETWARPSRAASKRSLIGYCHLEQLHNLKALPPDGFTVSCFR